MNIPSSDEKQISTLAAKRPWSTPAIQALRVEDTKLGTGGWFGEQAGLNGCTKYVASKAISNVCIKAS